LTIESCSADASIKCEVNQVPSVMVPEPLKRFYAILDGEEHARYLETKKIGGSADLCTSDEILWKAHDEWLQSPHKEPVSGDRTSLLDLKVELANRILRKCTLCERRCEARRHIGEKGHCGVLDPRISTEFLHMGEEPDLVPSHTIFFAGCTFNCVYCQNWDISTRPRAGREISPEDLAAKIEARALVHSKGTTLPLLTGSARNVNWVGGDPTSNLPFILKTLQACEVNIPQVWNSNMYLTEESMRLLDGVVDVYLTDFKYGNDRCASRLSNARDYTRIVTRNHILARDQCEMIIRHLVLPNHVQCCTRPVLEWIAGNLENVKVNVMAQYRPEHRAMHFDDIARGLKTSEFSEAVGIAEELGLNVY
jgi:putative pyruvate formate lyase activating enzyme